MTSSPMNAPTRSCLAVVLAAGEGTRMKSNRPKVLHEIAGRSVLGHVMAAVTKVGAAEVSVVVGPTLHERRATLSRAHASSSSGSGWERVTRS
jgi:bifunctional UDP-N-acetylglucosamine pyrophosphorylase / glucosamine-1-phosphate N-acetyltransferase